MEPTKIEIAELVQRLNQTANAYRQSILLLTANRFGLFTYLAGKRASAIQIAADLGWDGRIAEVFLNALAAMGFLKKAGGAFSNAEISGKLLVKGGPFYQGDILNHNLNLWERWSRVDEVLLSGEPLPEPGKRRGGDELRAFINGMANLAALTAGLLWEKVDLASRHRLLDVGGGPGVFALSACQVNPELEAVVFDLPEVEPIFAEHRKAAEVGRRAKFHAGDFLADPLPAGFDLALLSSIIHSYGEEDNRELIGKIHNSLVPGGLLLVKDFYLSEDGTEPLHAAVFALYMHLGTEEGGCYTRAAVETWLKDAGFEVQEYFLLAEQAGVVAGKKKA